MLSMGLGQYGRNCYLGWLALTRLYSLVDFYQAKRATREFSELGSFSLNLFKAKNETRLDSLYTEFESRRVESRVTRLTREFRVIIPGLECTATLACHLA